jgi:hypothetical protein
MIMNKFTAIDPAGKAHTRTSKTRTYTHTVVGRPSWMAAVKMVSSRDARATHCSNFKYHKALADGTSQWLEGDNETQRSFRIKGAQELVSGCNTGQDYSDKLVKEALARIEKKLEQGYYEKYQNLGWCGRADLAAKLKATSENHNWLNVTILPVQ